MVILLRVLRTCASQAASPVPTSAPKWASSQSRSGSVPPVGAWLLASLVPFVLLHPSDPARAQQMGASQAAAVSDGTGASEGPPLRTDEPPSEHLRIRRTQRDDTPGRRPHQTGHVRLHSLADSSALHRKSPARALTYSLGSTVLLAPFGVGLIAGPSVGHFYGGNSGQAWTGIGIRSGAFLTAGTGYTLILSATVPAVPEEPGETTDPGDFRRLGEWAEPTGTVLLVAGITVLLGSAVYDIATVRDAVRDYNQNRTVQARVTPAVGLQGEQIGLSIQLQF